VSKPDIQELRLPQRPTSFFSCALENHFSKVLLQFQWNHLY